MSEIQVHQLDAQVAVAPQLTPEAMQSVAAAGFKSVVNNRPDFEGGAAQPTAAALQAAAEACGLRYAHLPVAGGFQTPEQVRAMQALLDALPKPVLAFCRSGTRSSNLYAQVCALRDPGR